MINCYIYIYFEIRLSQIFGWIFVNPINCARPLTSQITLPSSYAQARNRGQLKLAQEKYWRSTKIEYTMVNFDKVTKANIVKDGRNCSTGS